MSRSCRLGILALLVVVGLIASISGLPGLAFAQDAEPGYREWTDATGQLHITAALEKVEDGKAHLRLKEQPDTVVPVDIARLSPEDQNFLRAYNAAQTTTPETPGASESPDTPADPPGTTPEPTAREFKPEDAVVVLRRDAGPATSATTTGIILYHSGNQAMIRAPTLDTNIFKSPTSNSTVSYGDAFVTDRPGKPDEHSAPLTLVPGKQNRVWATAPCDDLPKGLFDFPSAEPTSRQPITISGYVFDGRGGASSRFERADIHAMLYVEQGKPTIMWGSDQRLLDGVVTDSKGRVLGIVGATSSSSPSPSRSSKNTSLLTIAELQAQMVPTLLYDFHQSHSRITAASWGSDGVDLTILLRIRDDMERVVEPQLLIAPIGDDEPEATPESFDNYARYSPDMKVLPLTNVINGSSPVYRSSSRYRYLETSFKDQGPLDGTRPTRYVVQLRWTESDGVTRRSAPLAVGVSINPEAEPLLAKLPMMQRISLRPDGSFRLLSDSLDELDGFVRELPVPDVMPMPGGLGMTKEDGQADGTSFVSIKPNRVGFQNTPLLSSDGRYIFALSEQGALMKIDKKTYHVVKTLNLPDFDKDENSIQRWGNAQIAMTPMGVVATCKRDRLNHLICTVDKETMQPKRLLSVTGDAAFCRPGSTFVYVFDIAGLTIIDQSLASPQHMVVAHLGDASQIKEYKSNMSSYIYDVAFSEDGRYMRCDSQRSGIHGGYVPADTVMGAAPPPPPAPPLFAVDGPVVTGNLQPTSSLYHIRRKWETLESARVAAEEFVEKAVPPDPHGRRYPPTSRSARPLANRNPSTGELVLIHGGKLYYVPKP